MDINVFLMIEVEIIRNNRILSDHPMHFVLLGEVMRSAPTIGAVLFPKFNNNG